MLEFYTYMAILYFIERNSGGFFSGKKVINNLLHFANYYSKIIVLRFLVVNCGKVGAIVFQR